ncbi:hypothetical protein EI94DRAFT_1790172 [Lactarius quietus]|nr:hypothetical protein EI94DRAFT_1790172 [Lactarius quietus]
MEAQPEILTHSEARRASPPNTPQAAQLCPISVQEPLLTQFHERLVTAEEIGRVAIQAGEPTGVPINARSTFKGTSYDVNRGDDGDLFKFTDNRDSILGDLETGDFALTDQASSKMVARLLAGYEVRGNRCTYVEGITRIKRMRMWQARLVKERDDGYGAMWALPREARHADPPAGPTARPPGGKN